MSRIFLNVFEPTRAHCTAMGSYASLSVRLSIHLWLDKNYWTMINISISVAHRVMKFDQRMKRDDLRVDLEGQGHHGKTVYFWAQSTVLCRGPEWHGSRSKVTGVKIKCHVGQGEFKGIDIGRWAHINVKLLHLDFGCGLMILVAYIRISLDG